MVCSLVAVSSYFAALFNRIEMKLVSSFRFTIVLYSISFLNNFTIKKYGYPGSNLSNLTFFGFLVRDRCLNGTALPAPNFKMNAQHNGNVRLAL